MKKIILITLLLSVFQLSQAGVGESNFNHSIWNSLLQKHVTAQGVVNYDGFVAERKQLNQYLSLLESKAPNSAWSKSETMAYWINAYNAYTVKLILDHYPLKSIMEIKEGKAWDYAFIKLDNKMMSLNTIEHKILREKYADPRIHFAVNCASISCPKLRNSAFTGADLDKQLTEMARSFINNSSKNKLSASAVKISKLFDWYKADFTKEGSLIDFLNKYSKIKINPDASVTFLDYNWNLNNK